MKRLIAEFRQVGEDTEMTTIQLERSVFLCLCGILPTLFASGSALAQQEVNYGVQPDTDPSFIAKALGYFEPIEKKYNVKVFLRRAGKSGDGGRSAASCFRRNGASDNRRLAFAREVGGH